MKYAIPALAQTRGNIINMASLAGLGGVPLLGAYCGSKAAVIRLTQTAAVGAAARRDPRQRALPGFHPNRDGRAPGRAVRVRDGRELRRSRGAGAGRLGTPQEVAEMAVFLASDEASFVTGAYFILDNALSAAVL